MRVTIVDTGICNLGSLTYALESLVNERLDIKVSLLDELETSSIDRLIIPGVCHFDALVEKLNSVGFSDTIRSALVQTRVLGICAGFQVFGQSSEEGSSHGLGLFPFKTVALEKVPGKVFSPNIGWSAFSKKNASGFEQLGKQYFSHSYGVVETKKVSQSKVCYFSHGSFKYVAAYKNGNFWGAQFHPERSHNDGLAFLESFLCQ